VTIKLTQKTNQHWLIPHRHRAANRRHRDLKSNSNSTYAGADSIMNLIRSLCVLATGNPLKRRKKKKEKRSRIYETRKIEDQEDSGKAKTAMC
jgi:hypothetical protein